MKFKSLSLLAAVASLSLSASFTASAADGDVNPWKHCGIGAAIFEDNGTAAAVSNIIWDLGSTAVTSATLSEDTCSGKTTKTAQFIEENFEQLEQDIAIGEGEALTSLITMTGANATSVRTALTENVSATRTEKAQAIYFAATQS